MEIIVGKNAGFCFGVNRAVKGAEELTKQEKNIYCLGELVHNGQVVSSLEKNGMITIEKLEEIKDKSFNVIFRSHGVSKQVYEEAKEREIIYQDFTCPKVIYLHKLAEKYTNEGYFVILLGSKKHAENIGTISFCKKDNSYQIEDEEEIEKAIDEYRKSKLGKIVMLSQTTYSLDKFQKIENRIKNICPEIIIEKTICASTRLRQEETRSLAKNVDKMIIIGGKNSSNTRKLYEVAKKECEYTYIVETYRELNKENFEKEDKIGIMAGASTPLESIEEVEVFLKDNV